MTQAGTLAIIHLANADVSGPGPMPLADWWSHQAGGRHLGEQHCEDCNTFMLSLGFGGLSPCCGEPVTIDEFPNR